MAEKGSSKKRSLKRTQTVRERATKAQADLDKPRRLRKTAGSAGRMAKTWARLAGKEVYLPLPDSKLGNFLNKRRNFFPAYFRDAVLELRSVDWPSRRETWKLTFAVFTFALVFGIMVALVDYGLDKLFRRLILNS